MQVNKNNGINNNNGDNSKNNKNDDGNTILLLLLPLLLLLLLLIIIIIIIITIVIVIITTSLFQPGDFFAGSTTPYPYISSIFQKEIEGICHFSKVWPSVTFWYYFKIWFYENPLDAIPEKISFFASVLSVLRLFTNLIKFDKIDLPSRIPLKFKNYAQEQ